MDSGTGHLRYELLSEVGEGAYGKVYKAREVEGEQRLLAVKKLNVRGEATGLGIPTVMLREVSLLMKMRFFKHPNIVQLLDVSALSSSSGLDLTLVLEYIDQDLSTYLSTVPVAGLSRHKIEDVMQQLLQGLDFLHTNMVVHRDLKPDNILVSSSGKVKIADFGLARIYSFNMALTPGVLHNSRGKVVTLWYRAPEVLLNLAYTSSVDVWSVGCVFAELLLLRPLFQGYSEKQQLLKIFEVIGLPSEEDWPEDSPISYCIHWGRKCPGTKLLHNLDPVENHLLSQFLAFTPSRRVSAAKALAHPFFTRPSCFSSQEE